MMTRRIMGETCFVTLQDVGGRIQLAILARDDLSGRRLQRAVQKWDLGGIIGAKGSCSKPKP